MKFRFATEGYGLIAKLVEGMEGYHLAFGINLYLKSKRWRFKLWDYSEFEEKKK